MKEVLRLGLAHLNFRTPKSTSTTQDSLLICGFDFCVLVMGNFGTVSSGKLSYLFCLSDCSWKPVQKEPVFALRLVKVCRDKLYFSQVCSLSGLIATFYFIVRKGSTDPLLSLIQIPRSIFFAAPSHLRKTKPFENVSTFLPAA